MGPYPPFCKVATFRLHVMEPYTKDRLQTRHFTARAQATTASFGPSVYIFCLFLVAMY